MAASLLLDEPWIGPCSKWFPEHLLFKQYPDVCNKTIYNELLLLPVDLIAVICTYAIDKDARFLVQIPLRHGNQDL